MSLHGTISGIVLPHASHALSHGVREQGVPCACVAWRCPTQLCPMLSTLSMQSMLNAVHAKAVEMEGTKSDMAVLSHARCAVHGMGEAGVRHPVGPGPLV